MQKILEKIYRGNLQDHGQGKPLRLDTKATIHKRKICETKFLHNWKQWLCERPFNRMKIQAIDWEKIFANHIANTGLVSRT
jgi:hypothetical protein